MGRLAKVKGNEADVQRVESINAITRNRGHTVMAQTKYLSDPTRWSFISNGETSRMTLLQRLRPTGRWVLSPDHHLSPYEMLAVLLTERSF